MINNKYKKSLDKNFLDKKNKDNNFCCIETYNNPVIHECSNICKICEKFIPSEKLIPSEKHIPSK